jgi:hypothetical protein
VNVRCLFCGVLNPERDHLKFCDGRQGAAERLPSLEEAYSRRDDGIALVEGGAERFDAFDPEGAALCIVEHLRRYGVTKQEDLTLAAREAGHTPRDDRAFGGVFLRLRRRGLIVSVGTYPRRRGKGADGGHLYALGH